MWTAARQRGFSLADLGRWMCSGPAQLAGLRLKGAIAAGSDADLVIWNPEKSFRVQPGRLHQRHKISPYSGWELAGIVEKTIVGGTVVFDSGEFVSSPSGRVLRRGDA